MAQILDGKWVRDQIFADWKDRASTLGATKRRPGLAVVLVGHDPGSEIYVRNKIRACEDLGIYSEKHTPPERPAKWWSVAYQDSTSAPSEQFPF